MISAKKKIVTWASTSLSNLKVFISLRNGTLSGAASPPPPPVRSLQKRPYGRLKGQLTLSLPEWMLEFLKVVLTFESVDKILWCDHSNETPSACTFKWPYLFSKFFKTKFGNFCSILPLSTLGTERVKKSWAQGRQGGPWAFLLFRFPSYPTCFLLSETTL